jgi:3-deoxy-manno-octulosonate cytidylyltransferase (CMP-KDO synthetase)
LKDKSISIVVPARLESQRLKRKLLLNETGKPLIVHSLENLKPLSHVANIYLVTDSKEIAEAGEGHCDRVFYSPYECSSGTERICNILDEIETDWVLNVQADEPEINTNDLEKLIELCVRNESNFSMATIGSNFNDIESLNNPNAVKVIVGKNHDAVYFSRSVIPYGASYDHESVFHHIGIYAYKKDLLKVWDGLGSGPLEKQEKLEQLRALENGISISVMPVSCSHKGIDTEEDYKAFIKRELRRV